MCEKKIAMLFPYAPAYRELIYLKMDSTFDVDWYFCGNAERPLKPFDYSLLKKCDMSMMETKILGPIHRYKGIRNLNLDQYDAIIAPTVTRCLSLWWLNYKYGKKKHGPRLLLWTHGWYGKERGFEKLLKKFYYAKADGFFLYGNTARNIMIDMGYDSSSLFVIYNSLNYDTQLQIRNNLRPTNLYHEHFGNNNHNIVFIGRLRKIKKFGLLLEAISILKQKGEYINVTFIGDGEEKESMERFINEHELNNQVWFYGACYDERKNAELIFNADLCVSPGHIGLTAMHVMMFGCPAITSDDFNHQTPEFEAVIDGKTGSFFKADDSYSLSECIREWFKIHGSERELIRKNCYDEIDSHWNPNYQISVIKNALRLYLYD